MTDENTIEDAEEFAKQHIFGSSPLSCKKCGKYMDPDQEKCSCGWKNPMVQFGLI